MPGTPLERVLQRDRLLVLAALIVITILAWVYIAVLARDMDMGGMPMTGYRMAATGLRMAMAPASRPWTPAEFAGTFVMWTVMMVGMMTPSVAPLLLLHARTARQASERGRPFATTGWFAGGYLTAWAVFSLAATAAQFALERAALLTAYMATENGWLTGVILIAAGAYQWSHAKDVCLTHCRSPIAFLQHHGGYRADARGAWMLGVRHGLYCVGCCWVLMLVLFAGGVMSLAWIAGLSALVLVEKLLAGGRLLARAAGVAMAVAGLAWVFAS
jgi:predicted metal-binding membrane protein